MESRETRESVSDLKSRRRLKRLNCRRSRAGSRKFPSRKAGFFLKNRGGFSGRSSHQYTATTLRLRSKLKASRKDDNTDDEDCASSDTQSYLEGQTSEMISFGNCSVIEGNSSQPNGDQANRGPASGFYVDRKGSSYTQSDDALVAFDQRFLCGLYCDVCQSNLIDIDASEHLNESLHYSASTYRVNTYNLPNTLPQGARITKADNIVADFPLSKSAALFVCKHCKKPPIIANNQLDIDSHVYYNHLNKSDAEHCIQYGYSKSLESIEIDVDLLVKCVKSEEYPCIKCHIRFSTAKEAARHMYEQEHSCLKKCLLVPIEQPLIFAKCETCTYPDIILTSNEMLLMHLVKVHGQYQSSLLGMNSREAEGKTLGLLKTVEITFRSYEYFETKRSLQFEDNLHKTDSYMQHKRLYSKRVESKSKYLQCLRFDCGKESKQHDPSVLQCKPSQQYCCDLCGVPLGQDTNTAKQHMTTFNHCSVSLYNTVVDKGENVSIISVHSYGVFQDMSKMYCHMVFKCGAKCCPFISADPLTCAVHQEVIHGMKFDKLNIRNFNLHTTTVYTVVINENGSISCPSCHQFFRGKKDLMNHMAGMKHNSMVDNADNLIDISRCKLCGPDDPRALCLKETQLIDHLLKHKKTARLECKYIVTSFKFSDQRKLVPYETDWLKHRAQLHILRYLMKAPSTSKVMRRKYTNAYKCLRERNPIS